MQALTRIHTRNQTTEQPQQTVMKIISHVTSHSREEIPAVTSSSMSSSSSSSMPNNIRRGSSSNSMDSNSNVAAQSDNDQTQADIHMKSLKIGTLSSTASSKILATHDPDNDTPESTNPTGILSSAKRWIRWQRLQWKKQSLCKAVEEQTKILQEEMKKLAHHEQSIEWQNQFVRNLNDNSTFQSLTHDHPHRYDADDYPGTAAVSPSTSSSLGFPRTFCGITLDDLQDDQQEDYVDDTQVSLSSVDPQEGSCDAIPSDVTSNTHVDDSVHNFLTGKEQEDVPFRIRTPRETGSGGIAVRLEFVHDEYDCNLMMGRNNRRPSERGGDLIKVFEEDETCSVPFILTVEQMTHIAENGLPPNVLFSKWKRVYSLQRDGDSFVGAFMKKVQHEDRTLLVVETTNHEIIGAYSNSPWKGHGPSGSACFYGSAQASLFSINKDTQEINVYKWTGKNRFIQVCDMQHKLIALGGGGKDGEFGLCVEDDFRLGSTGPCETFDNPQLCSQNQFEILNLECWGFVSGFC